METREKGPAEAEESGVPPEPKKVLVLTIEVPGIWADDLDENVRDYFGDDDQEATPEDRLEAFLDTWMHESVGLTILTRSQDEDPDALFSYTARVVGVEARDR